MAPGDVTSREAVLRAMQEYDELGRVPFLDKYGFGKATKFVVEHDGHQYDSKALLAAAHGFQYPDEGALSNNFSGGDQTTSPLRSLGFTITTPTSPASAQLAVQFNRQDCELFSRYPRSVHWDEHNIPAEDQRAFKSIRNRLKELADWVATTAQVGIPLKPFASQPTPNGRSPETLWSCAFPVTVPNKSYGLQVALIISADGAEICVCLGAGRSQVRGTKLVECEQALQWLKSKLAAVPTSVVRALGSSLPEEVSYRKSWLDPDESDDFDTLEDWLEYAAGPNGAGASISRNISVSEIDGLGSLLAGEVLEMANAAAPLLDYCYLDYVAPGEIVMDFPTTNSLSVSFDAESLEQIAVAAGLAVDQSIYRAIIAGIGSGKHLILTGPPGTAKTTLAELTCQLASDAGLCSGYALTTASADWTTYETIGGLRPVGSGGRLEFREGLFLDAVRSERWLVVDELNRSNFDRAFGQLFTVLSGQSVVLPYEDPASGRRIALILEGAAGRYSSADYKFLNIPRSWRIVATMNVFDKSLLFEMSFALMRRFAFIEVPSPPDHIYAEVWRRELDGLSGEWTENIDRILQGFVDLRSVKDIGPAVFIDMARFARAYVSDGNTATEHELAFQLFYSYLLPQFEGITNLRGIDLFRRVQRLVGEQLGPRLDQALTEVLGLDLKAGAYLAEEETYSDEYLSLREQ